MYTVKTITLLALICLTKIGFAQTVPPPPATDSKSDADKIFTQVEVEADFPGGSSAWGKFLSRNLNGDIGAKNGAPCGIYNTVIKFIVGRDGVLNGINAETNEGYGMEDEVIRVIKKSGKWTPAYQNGRAVNAYRRQPVTFKVDDENIDITTRVPYTFFAGTDNQLNVAVKKVKPEDLQLTISKGSIKQIAEGKYVVRVNGPGRVIIEFYNSKKNKPVGAASFEVKAGTK